jgi:hypothetical protein
MLPVFPRFLSVRSAVLLASTLLCSLGVQAQSYDPATMKLTLPTVGLGDQHYQSVVVKIDQMSVMGVDSATVMALSEPSFDPAGNLLLLPSVEVSGTVYHGVTVKLEQFSVVSVGSNNTPTTATSGACTSTGTTMTYSGSTGPFANGEKVCVVGNGSTTLTVGGKALSNPVQNTAVTAPYAAYAFTDSATGYSYETVLNSGSLYEINVMSGSSFLGQLAP